MKLRLNLQLSCYNGARYLPSLFASLAKQTDRDWELFVLDNASDAANKQLIEEAVAASGLPVHLFRVEKNMGFAGAHNFLFEKTAPVSDAIQLLNDDAVLEPAFLETCRGYLAKQPRVAAVTGTILRWDFDARETSTQGKTETVDSLGLAVDWRGFVRDRGMGEPLASFRLGRAPVFVFGVSGCLPMYRVSAVERVSLDGGLFDRSFRIYKEDVELAYRLKAGGYAAAVVPDAVAYHRRGYGTKSLLRPTNENAYHSYRNHLWTLLMHLPFFALVSTRVGVVPFECAKAAYWGLRKPAFLWWLVRDTWRHRSELACKRAAVVRLRAACPAKTTHDIPKPSADIAVIMVGHNDLNDVTLASLAKAVAASKRSVEVVVVDNQSASDANVLVERHLPSAWTLLRNGDFGYGRSMNVGAAFVDAEYYFILNPDTELMDPAILDKLYAKMREEPNIGLLAPKIFYFDGRLQETCRRFPKWFMPFVQRTGLKNTALGKRYAEAFLMADYDHETPKDVDWVQGSAMFVDGALWKRLGGFDDRFWMYFEDVDLCRRVQAAGRAVRYWPGVSIRHAHGKESAKIKSFVRNLVQNKVARAHIWSWIKYELKWRIMP
jgi:GT2 family glycosyltransferase